MHWAEGWQLLLLGSYH